MSFTFIHAADLHIDSPLDGLGCKDATVAARFADAGRRAVTGLIDLALDSKSAFLLVSGDIFDGDWRDVSTGHFFVKELSRLSRENIPAFIVRGNHDAESQISKSLPYPANVHVFSSRSASTHSIEGLRVALHGRSFGARNPDAGFISSYPARREGWFNIGLLHTALDGSRGHNCYAPCTVEDLRRFGYDYWALGHVHAREEVCRDPHIVYPGNLQGRNVRETGPKGATRVEVADGRVSSLAHVPLDGARWAHLRLDATNCADEAGLLAEIETRLGEEHAKADGRALALRLTLAGVTPLHERLVARREAIEADARALAFRFGDDFWIEQLKIETSAPPARSGGLSAADALGVEALIVEAADARYAQSVAELLEEVAAKAPREVGEALRCDLDAAALAKEACDLLLGELAIATGGA